jgi:pSer/pThr/pTyr-binding forkhead associated (FHA) protein
MREARQVQRFGRQGERMKGQMGRYSPDVRSTDKSKKGTGPNAFLEVVESMTQRSGRIELTSVEMKIGRSTKQADIVFNKDGTVSRIHASIVQEGNDYRIFDEQSTSGTFVNEQRVPEYGLQLEDGDEIRLGGVRLRFRNM